MKYGYFDDVNREYVIDHPNTPKPWVNYLGSPEYGAIISNNAGGYSFAKSGANGRILRYVFNNFDQPGRYITFETMIPKTSGLPHGNLLVKTLKTTTVNATMVWATLK